MNKPFKNLTGKNITFENCISFIQHLNPCRDLILQCLLALGIFLLGSYRLSEIGQPILFNDEIGYWSNSAFFMGLDWTSVTGQIGYYSYGYSLLLIPLRVMAALFGWRWNTLYRAGVLMNATFLVLSYVLALKLTERYLPDMNRYIRIFACFVIFTYPSDIVYAHITWTECTLLFFFWIFLYVMMRVVDKPGIANHIAFGIVPFYLYAVHQRALGIIVTAVIIVLYMRLQKRNKVRDVAAFLGSMYLCSLIHAMVKGNLQNVNYLGGEAADVSTILGYAFTKRSLILLSAGAVLLFLLYLLDKGKGKLAFALVIFGIAFGVGYWHFHGVSGLAVGETPNRLSTNDFSGQWRVIRNIFSRNGLIRLGISITGKWFYLAAGSGLVVCWGIYGLFKNALILLIEDSKQLINSFKKKEHHVTAKKSVPVDDIQEAPKIGNGGNGIEGNPLSLNEAQDKHSAPAGSIWQTRIWLLGVLLAWLSTFMIGAIYKEGLYKNDDLVNGRYNEFVLGFILLYSLNCLINDRKWIRSTIICVVLYIAAGWLCQYTFNELRRTDFELAHCIMFGRIIWNYEVPVGKIAEILRYTLRLGGAFLLVLKFGRERLMRFRKVTVARTILALMIPVLSWSYLGRRIVDVYVVVRNEKQAEPFVQFADWIAVLGSSENVYYLLDYANERYAGALQYMLQDKPVSLISYGDLSFTEDAFYVMKDTCWEWDGVSENCEIVMNLRGYLLVINKNQHLAERWAPFKD